MLVEFTVGNFRSFNAPMCLSLEATKLKAHEPTVDSDNLAQAGDFQLLKVAGIYGANASGKSNLVLALRKMADMVRNSSREGQVGDGLGADPFLLASTGEGEPTLFECVFFESGAQYRFGFENTETEIVREWLYMRSKGSHQERRLFLRENTEYKFHATFRKEGSPLRSKTRPNALHLSVCAQFAGPIATTVMSWFEKLEVVHGLHSVPSLIHESERLLSESAHAKAIRSLVLRLDVDIDDLEVTNVEVDEKMISDLPANVPSALRQQLIRDGYKRLKTTHSVRDGSGQEVGTTRFDIQVESDGTQKLIGLAGLWVVTLERGGVVVIDEFDARLHPFISRELVKIFQSSDTNPNNAQLVFVTHDTNLLDHCLLRRDQYWFIEKSRKYGSSDLYSLAELREDGKSVRADARLERNYLQGRYGAVPALGGLAGSISRDMAALFSEDSRTEET